MTYFLSEVLPPKDSKALTAVSSTGPSVLTHGLVGVVSDSNLESKLHTSSLISSSLAHGYSLAFLRERERVSSDSKETLTKLFEQWKILSTVWRLPTPFWVSSNTTLLILNSQFLLRVKCTQGSWSLSFLIMCSRAHYPLHWSFSLLLTSKVWKEERWKISTNWM